MKYFEDPFIKILKGIDLHGETSDTAPLVIKDFIKESSILGREKVYFIHGRHGKIIKEVVQKELKKNKLVSNYYIYGQNDGITIAELKNNTSKI